MTGAAAKKTRKLSLTDYEVWLPKLGWCPVTLPRELPVHKVTSYTVKKAADGTYTVSFNTTQPVNTAKTASTNPDRLIGIDLGCVVTVMTSTGVTDNCDRPDLDAKIAAAQKAWSQTKKGSNRRGKARRRLARRRARQALRQLVAGETTH